MNSLVVIGRTVYVGGAYYTIAGQSRNSLAAVDALTGAVLPWNPDPIPGDLVAPYIYALAAIGDTLYVGGGFGGISGQIRHDFAAISATSGIASTWNPDPDGVVWSLTASGSTLYVGGGFSRFGTSPDMGLAGLIFGPPSPAGQEPPLVVESIAPDPVSSTASVRFALPAPASASLEVYDVQGRRIATLLDHQLMSAGWHEQPLDAENWPKGVYFCRLQAGGSTASRRFVVLR